MIKAARVFCGELAIECLRLKYQISGYEKAQYSFVLWMAAFYLTVLKDACSLTRRRAQLYDVSHGEVSSVRGNTEPSTLCSST